VERQYVAIDLHLNRSVVVRENEASEKVGVTRIDKDPRALAEALREAGVAPEVAIEATYGWVLGRRHLRGTGSERSPREPGDGTGFSQTFGVDNGQVLHAAVVDQAGWLFSSA
jgi:hypothetical protein